MRKLLVSVCSGALLVGGLSFMARAEDKPAAAEKKTVEGELVDLHCYSAGGAQGEEHGAKCGAACAKSGIPVAPWRGSSTSGSSCFASAAKTSPRCSTATRG